MEHEIDERVLSKNPPIDEDAMLQRLPLYTICEVLREIYWLSNSEDIRLRVRMATTMAKKMGDKLEEYKCKLDNTSHFDATFLFTDNTSELWEGLAHDRRRWYVSEKGTSSLMHDILPREVTLIYNPSSMYTKQDTFHKEPKSTTVFDEVSILEYKKSCSDIEYNFGMLDIPHEDYLQGNYSREAFKRFKKAILNKWTPDKLHVVFHSSGYDSRMISVALKELYEEHGSALGEVMFLNNSWEAENFKQIMEIEGWDESQYIIVNEDEKDPTMAFAGSFDFDIAWEQLNCGMISYPVNANFEPIRWCQERGILPEDSKIQCIGGSGSNEISRNIREQRKIGYYFERQYYHPLSTFPLKGGDWIFPFLDLSFIWFVLKYSPESVIKQGISKPILDECFPNVQEVVRITPRQLKAMGYMTINSKLVDQAFADYKGSWFYKTMKIDVKPTNVLGYSEWWGLWALASTCEHLIEEGIEVTMWRDK